MLCAGYNTEWPLPLCGENNWAHFNPDHWTKWSQRAVKLYSCLPHFSSFPAIPTEVTKILKDWSFLHYLTKVLQSQLDLFSIYHYLPYHFLTFINIVSNPCAPSVFSKFSTVKSLLTCLGLENLNKLKGKHLRNRANTVH